MKSSMAVAPPMYGLRSLRPVRRACAPLGAVAAWVAVLAAACLVRVATLAPARRTGTVCPGLLDRAKREGEYVP